MAQVKGLLLATYVLAGSCVLVGCGGDIKTVDLPRVTSLNAGDLPRTMPAGDARVRIASPKNGDPVAGPVVKVVIEVSGFRLRGASSAAPARGEGRVVYYAGAAFQAPTAKGRPATSGGSGEFVSAVSGERTYTWFNVEPGRRTFAVQLVASDIVPLDPPQVAYVTVEVT